MRDRTRRTVAASLLVVVVVLVAARPAGAAQADAPPVEPERAERVARDVVDGLDLDEPHEPDRSQDQPQGGSAFGAVGQVLAYLLVGAAAAGLAYVIVALVRGGGRRRGREKTDDGGGIDVETGRVEAEDRIDALTAAQWRVRAEDAEAQGRFADAVRFLHFGGLLGLDEDGLVAFDPGRPNGDYVRVVAERAPGPASHDLGHLNRLMEDATFGKREMDAAAVDWSRSGWARVRAGFAGAGASTQ